MRGEDMTPLTEVDKGRYDRLDHLLGGRYLNARPALMRADLSGHPVAVVVAVSEEDGETMLDPVAILVDNRLMDHLDPGDNVGQVPNKPRD